MTAVRPRRILTRVSPSSPIATSYGKDLMQSVRAPEAAPDRLGAGWELNVAGDDLIGIHSNVRIDDLSTVFVG